MRDNLTIILALILAASLCFLTYYSFKARDLVAELQDCQQERQELEDFKRQIENERCAGFITIHRDLLIKLIEKVYSCD